MSEKVVALDIGHGVDTYPPSKGVEKDGRGYAEHDFNSKLTQAIDLLLRANGIKTVIYQKPYTKDIGLTTRTNYYNAQKVNLVYSIHANANSNSDINGRCVFYWHTSKEGKRLADIIANEIKEAGYSTHGNGLHASKKGSWTNLHICRETDMVSVLIENGFMTGNKDFDLIFGNKQSKYIEDMAQVHAKSICKYFGMSYSGGKKPAPSKPSTSNPANPKPSKPSTNKPNPNSGRYTGGSIVDYLNSIKVDSSPTNRRKLAKEYGVSNYDLTAKKNTELLNKMRQGKPTPVKTPTPSATEKTSSSNYKVGQNIRIKTSAKKYSRASINIPSKHKNKSYTVQQVGKDDVLIKELVSWVKKSDLQESVSTVAPSKTASKSKSYKAGQKIKIKPSAKTYATGEAIPSRFKNKTYTIQQVSKNDVLIEELVSWVKKSDLR